MEIGPRFMNDDIRLEIRLDQVKPLLMLSAWQNQTQTAFIRRSNASKSNNT